MVQSRLYGLQYLGLAVLATIFSIILHYVWDLEPRWFVVVVVGIAMISISMCFAVIFSDFLLMVLFFTLPISSFVKWFFPTGYDSAELGQLVYGGVFGLSPMDFILAGLYAAWFYRIFVERSAPIPRLEGMDAFVLALFFCHLLSSIGANEPALSLHADQYFAKFALLYFYVSRHLQRRHLPWLIAAMCFSICLEAALGTIQYSTGKWMGIALDKGAGTSEVNYQYVVPGLENRTRATGTTYDSHALGDFVGMMLPFVLILFFKPEQWRPMRPVFAAASSLAILTIALSLSRSAWLGCAISLTLGMLLILFVWRDREIARMLFVFSLFGSIALWVGGSFLYERFELSPIETLTQRFGQYEVAFEIIKAYPLFGVGPGNYLETFKRFDFLWLDELPVHNVLMWVAAETGLLGLVCYVGLVLSALKRLMLVAITRRDLLARLAMATALAIATHLLNGLTDPTFREPSVWTMFWVTMALAFALSKMQVSGLPSATIPAYSAKLSVRTA
jgi:hypothetical protein